MLRVILLLELLSLKKVNEEAKHIIAILYSTPTDS
jgi:hypothetical protein